MTDELERDLEQRRGEFATLINIPVSLLDNLVFCEGCGGLEYRWDDVTMDDIAESWIIDDEEEDDEVNFYAYRAYLAETECRSCEGTSFNGIRFSTLSEDLLRVCGIDLEEIQLSS